MLDKFKVLLGEKPRVKSENRNHNPNFVTDPKRIVSLLNDLVYQRAVLFLCTNDRGNDEDLEEMTTTYLYKVGTERAALQKVDDPGDDLKLREARVFKVITDLFNNVLTFKAEILDIQKEGDQEYYIIGLPDRIYYPKNCKPRQIKISSVRKVPVYLRFEDAPKTVPGLVDDLSTRSIGILLSSENTILPYVRKGDEPKACSLGIGTRQIKFEARVTQVKRINDKAVRIDCSFKSLNPELETAIAGLINEAAQSQPKK
jgi:hypothetical protein